MIKKIKKKSLFKNTIYAFIVQIVNLLFSLFTSPYISRILGPDNLGRVNFSSAIVGWFTIFALYGTATYGVRAIVNVKNDKQELSRTFKEIMLVKFYATMIALVAYIAMVFTVGRFRENMLLYFVQGIILLTNLFSVDWLFQALEDYGYLAFRSVFVKVLSVVGIFLFIKSSEDYIWYALISVIAASFSNFFNIFYFTKKIDYKIKSLNIRRHFKGLSYFMGTTLLINVYTMLDQTLLGFIKTDADVAYMARGRLFLNVGNAVMISIVNAFMPRVLASYSDNQTEYMDMLGFTKRVVLMFAVPISLGLLFIAPYTMYLFGTEDFLNNATFAFQILCVSIPFSALGNWNYMQRVTPSGLEKRGFFVVIGSAILNCILNLILIYFYGVIGAAAAYTITEIVSNTVWFLMMHKKDGFRIIKTDVIVYIVAGAVMLACMWGVSLLLSGYTWLNMVLLIAVAVIIYFLVLLLLRDKCLTFMIKKFLCRIKRLQKSSNGELGDEPNNNTEDISDNKKE